MNHTPIPAKKFREILDATPICTVDILFFNENWTKTLLFRRRNEPLRGIYFAAGGRLLKNEKMLDGAVRQGMREVGLKLEKRRLKFEGIAEEIHKNSAFGKVSYHAVVIYYSYVMDENKINPKLDSQHSEYRWFRLKDKKIHPLIKFRIKKIIKNHGKEF